MKRNKLIAGFLLVSMCATISCSKKIDEAYMNPNSDVRVPVETLLPNIIASMAANAAGHGTMNDIRYAGQYIQNWVFANTGGNFDRMGYTNNVADVAQSTWRMHYYDIGQNNQRMIQWALEEKKWDYAGVGKAIDAWSWLILTDYYGDVPLKQAFNTSLITFQYDTQEEVYEHVKQSAKEAIELLSKTGDNANSQNLAKGDAYFYNGDVEKWKKFANGVLARVYNRYSDKPSLYKADSVIYYAEKAINDNADNAMVNFAATNLTGTQNFFGPNRSNLTSTGSTTPTAIRQSDFIAKLMSGGNSAFPAIPDPRAIYMLRLNTNGTFKGLQPNKGTTVIPANDRPENFWGASQAAGVTNIAGSTPRYIFQNDAPFPIMTATEMQFLKAEAYFKKGDKTNALTAYRNGISLDFDMLTGTTAYTRNIPAGMEITPASKGSYLAAVVPASAANLTLSGIMLQKYIALFGYGVLETWVDMRRYHYTDPDPSGTGQVYADFLPPSGGDLYPDNNGKLIYRYYPRFNSEYVWNINELKRIGATAIDYHTVPTWFTQP
jgi:hypothetical protein